MSWQEDAELRQQAEDAERLRAEGRAARTETMSTAECRACKKNFRNWREFWAHVHKCGPRMEPT